MDVSTRCAPLRRQVDDHVRVRPIEACLPRCSHVLHGRTDNLPQDHPRCHYGVPRPFVTMEDGAAKVITPTETRRPTAPDQAATTSPPRRHYIHVLELDAAVRRCAARRHQDHPELVRRGRDKPFDVTLTRAKSSCACQVGIRTASI